MACWTKSTSWKALTCPPTICIPLLRSLPGSLLLTQILSCSYILENESRGLIPCLGEGPSHELQQSLYIPFLPHLSLCVRVVFLTVVSPRGLLLLLSCFSRVRLCVTPWTAAHQAPPSLGFSRQEHWSGSPFPSPMHESEKRK